MIKTVFYSPVKKNYDVINYCTNTHLGGCVTFVCVSVLEFQVSVLQAEVPELCALQGSYRLLVDEEKLILRDTDSRHKVAEWPYKLLRRYGCDKVRKEPVGSLLLQLLV